MSGLIGSLTMASQSLDAQRYGLEVTGQNIANLNTDGYVRRTVDLEEVASGSGGGVRVSGVRAERDRLLDLRVRRELPAREQQAAVADSLGVVEASLGEAGTSIDGRLTAFFDAFSKLSDDPTSSVARDGTVLQGQLLARGFRDMSARLDDSARAADAQIRAGVDRINSLAAQIAALNVSIADANGGDVETLKDRQNTALATLAGLADVVTLERPEGGVDVSIGTGRALVVGGQQYTVGAAASGASGFAAITIGGADITQEVTRGQMGGWLQVRDTLLPGYENRLDQIAFAVVQQVNALHQAGFDMSATSGHSFFTPLSDAGGAARAIAVDPAIAADPTMVAASRTGASGDNQTAKAIVALRDGRTMSGGTATLTDMWSQLVYRVGSDASTASAQRQSRQQIVDQIARLRDQVSGVSLDEEAATMLKFQRAYEANARFFRAVDEALTTLMNMVGAG